MSNEEGREPTEGVVDGPFQTTFRNVGNFRKTNTKEVKRKGHRFTMEVASGDDCAIRQDNGVIRSGVDFDINLFFDKAQGILAGAVDLRYAAEGVRILNLQFPLMGNVGRVFQEAADVVGRIKLAAMRTDRMEPFVKSINDAAVSFHRKGSSDITLLDKEHAIPKGEGTHSRQDRSPIDEGQTFLGNKADGRDPSAIHGFLAAHQFALIFSITQSKHRKDHMS